MTQPGIDKNHAKVPQACGRRLISGFSLVELMVAMVIGMLGIVVMMQVFSVFESQRRTTSSGDDSISSGAISLYGIQREIQQSGWGISNVQLIGCSVTGLLTGGANLPLVPLTINSPLISGQDPHTDTLLIVSGNGNATVEGNSIESVTLTPPASYAVNGASDFSPGDLVVGVPQVRPMLCALAAAKSNGAISGPNVPFASAFAGITNGDRLFNLGKKPTVRVYAIRSGNLTVCDYTAQNCGLAANNDDSTIWMPIASNVVSMRAEYGRDTTIAIPLPSSGSAMSGVVDKWDQAARTPYSPYVAKNTAACGLLRVAAVRLALVARSSQPERTLDWPLHANHVMTHLLVNPSLDPRIWMGSDAVAHGVDPAAAAAVVITLPDPNPAWPTWQDFRYKVFQTVIPLRNITSQGAVPEC